MAYTPNSAKDSRGDEHLYVQDFERNRQAIEAHKRRRGGSYEKAYQAVTGRPWPEGRSVKIKNGRAEMTKDRTFKSVLGKYVAPIGAGAATALTLGGAAPALAGLFGGGGGAAAGGTGAGVAGASGAAGTLGGAGFGLPAAAGGILADSGAAALLGAGAAGGAAGAAGQVAGAGGGIRGALSGLGLGPQEAAALGLMGAQFFGGGGSGGGDSLSGVGGGVALEDLLALQTSQAKRQDPLHQAVTQLATNLLPNSAFGAGPNRPLVR